MKKILALLRERSLWIFLLIGLCNTFLSLCIMFLLYNLAGLGYWLSSATAFALTSISSFYFNKRFSFQNKDRVWKAAIRFSLVIAVCYLAAYSVAQPATAVILSVLNLHWPKKVLEQAAMLVGQVVFTGLNYFGQRFFAFKNR